MTYVTYLFGFPAGTFRICTRLRRGCCSTGSTSPPCLVLAGIGLSLWRRMRDKGARTLQSFGDGLLSR